MASTLITIPRLKQRLLATGIKQNRCEGEGCTVSTEPQKVHKWMQTMMPKFYEDKCFKRKPHSHPKTP